MFIILGFVIALGNNLFYYSAEHALEKNDVDHKNDGAFISLKSMCSNFGYGISPLLLGFIYYFYGFRLSLMLISGLTLLIGIWMIYLTWKFEEKVSY